MRKTLPILIAIVLCGAVFTVPTAALAGSGGSSSDPLVSQSWVDSYVDAKFDALDSRVAELRDSVNELLGLSSFSDVAATDWFYPYVTSLARAQVINGYPDGSFRPQNKVTYGEALKLVLLASGYGTQAATGTHWASGYLSLAQQKGLLSGSPSLDAPITRSAVAELAAKALGLSARGQSPFSDTSSAAVIALYEAKIIDGYTDGTFRGNNTLTRAEVSAIVYRIKQQ